MVDIRITPEAIRPLFEVSASLGLIAQALLTFGDEGHDLGSGRRNPFQIALAPPIADGDRRGPKRGRFPSAL